LVSQEAGRLRPHTSTRLSPDLYFDDADHFSIGSGCGRRVKPYNIRTTVISPGAVATELPNSVTEPDIAENVRKLYELAIPADSFARVVAFAMSQPEEVDANEILFRPTRQEL
jgi:NADP-dependent 3-hydroxy acid dehydrogenase YdfG